MTTIDNYEDLLDSSAIIDRIEQLEEMRKAMPNTLEDWPGTDEAEELVTLQALTNKAAQYSEDWQHGATLIRRSYFVDYCKDLLDDCGELPKDLPGYVVIDWASTARNLEADYTPVDFGGVEYLVR